MIQHQLYDRYLSIHLSQGGKQGKYRPSIICVGEDEDKYTMVLMQRDDCSGQEIKGRVESILSEEEPRSQDPGKALHKKLYLP